MERIEPLITSGRTALFEHLNHWCKLVTSTAVLGDFGLKVRAGRPTCENKFCLETSDLLFVSLVNQTHAGARLAPMQAEQIALGPFRPRSFALDDSACDLPPTEIQTKIANVRLASNNGKYQSHARKLFLRSLDLRSPSLIRDTPKESIALLEPR